MQTNNHTITLLTVSHLWVEIIVQGGREQPFRARREVVRIVMQQLGGQGSQNVHEAIIG
jgi:hypothetical protein